MFGKPYRVGVNGWSCPYSGGAEDVPLSFATPELLWHCGIDPASIDPGTDIVTSRTDLGGYDLIGVVGPPRDGQRNDPGRDGDWHPRIQHAALPTYTSLPGALLTVHALRSLHLTVIPTGWLVRAPRPLTQARIDQAGQTALAAGLSVEARPTGADAAQLATYATGAGIAVALGVLAMTVGLIRSETARDLRTLTATGARRRTRRALTAATAAALALLGVVIGACCAYLALAAWYHRELHWLGHVPVLDLAVILVGLPVLAYAGGWLFAAKEIPTSARQAAD